MRDGKSVSVTVIGNRMVKCTLCDAASTIEDGTPARCLWTDNPRSTDNGVIVVGLNPGRASPEEKQYYQKHGPTFGSTISYLETNAGSIRYFSRLRRLAKETMDVDAFHWTEVAKCELKAGLKQVPLEMRRTCIKQYLADELSLLPVWPVIAAGGVAFETMALLCRDRPVIGVPHPTGAFGKMFTRLLADGILGAWARTRVQEALETRSAVWLMPSASEDAHGLQGVGSRYAGA